MHKVKSLKSYTVRNMVKRVSDIDKELEKVAQIESMFKLEKQALIAKIRLGSKRD